MDMQTSTPLHSTEAEQSVLGGLMLVNDAWHQIDGRLCESDFYRQEHRLIFRAIAELLDAGQPCDAVTLGDWFERHGKTADIGGAAYLAELANNTPSAANITAYADIVRDKAILRARADAGAAIAAAAARGDVEAFDRARAKLEQLDARAVREAGPDRELSTVHMLTATPAPTDYLFGGLALVAGTTGGIVAQGDTGKSVATLELSISLALAGTGGEPFDPLCVSPVAAPTREGWRVVYYATEDPDQQMHQRVHAITSGLAAEQITTLARNLRVRTLHGAKFPMRVADPSDQRRIIETCRGARLVVLDTLTRFHEADENSNTEMVQVIAAMERIARETGAAVVALHHIGKVAAGDKSTSAHAARGASAITDNMRWVLHLARDAESGDVIAVEAKHNYGRGSQPFGLCWQDRVLYRTGVATTPAGKRNGGGHAGVY